MTNDKNMTPEPPEEESIVPISEDEGIVPISEDELDNVTGGLRLPPYG